MPRSRTGQQATLVLGLGLTIGLELTLTLTVAPKPHGATDSWVYV